MYICVSLLVARNQKTQNYTTTVIWLLKMSEIQMVTLVTKMTKTTFYSEFYPRALYGTV